MKAIKSNYPALLDHYNALKAEATAITGEFAGYVSIPVIARAKNFMDALGRIKIPDSHYVVCNEERTLWNIRQKPPVAAPAFPEALVAKPATGCFHYTLIDRRTSNKLAVGECFAKDFGTAVAYLVAKLKLTPLQDERLYWDYLDKVVSFNVIVNNTGYAEPVHHEFLDAVREEDAALRDLDQLTPNELKAVAHARAVLGAPPKRNDPHGRHVEPSEALAKAVCKSARMELVELREKLIQKRFTTKGTLIKLLDSVIFQLGGVK